MRGQYHCPFWFIIQDNGIWGPIVCGFALIRTQETQAEVVDGQQYNTQAYQ